MDEVGAAAYRSTHVLYATIRPCVVPPTHKDNAGSVRSRGPQVVRESCVKVLPNVRTRDEAAAAHSVDDDGGRRDARVAKGATQMLRCPPGPLTLVVPIVKVNGAVRHHEDRYVSDLNRQRLGEHAMKPPLTTAREVVAVLFER